MLTTPCVNKGRSPFFCCTSTSVSLPEHCLFKHWKLFTLVEPSIVSSLCGCTANLKVTGYWALQLCVIQSPVKAMDKPIAKLAGVVLKNNFTNDLKIRVI